MKKKVEVTDTRMAGEDHAVVTIEGGAFNSRPKPCAGCPWVKANDGLFPAQAFIHSAPTAYDMAQRMFGCHEAGQAKPQTCAGFLLRGADHNLSVRMKMAKREYSPADVSEDGRELHDNYKEMAVANGCDPQDPALKPCR